MIVNPEKRIYGIQFHPEVVHTEQGTEILKNFVLKVCGTKQDWTMKGFIESEVEKISKIEGNVVHTRIDNAVSWFRKNSIWPMPMGLACCGIELMAAGASRYDISRFGSEVMRFSPRQADCMIVAGTVTYKMAEVVRRIYEQMGDPKWVVAMGACASSGGMYRSYATLQGVDRVVPVDVYVSGCPPRPEALLDAMIKLQEKIKDENSVKNLLTKHPINKVRKDAVS